MKPLNDAEIKVALTVLLTADGKGKQAKSDSLQKLLLDAREHGPAAAIAIIRTYF